MAKNHPDSDPTPVTPSSSKLALDAPRGTMFHMNPDAIVIVGLDTDHKPGAHPLFPETEAARLKIPLDDDMIASIREFGVIQAVTTVKIAIRTNEDGADTEPAKKAVVIAGRRRVLHARRVNQILREEGLPEITVPVTVRTGTALEDARLLSVIENEHRAATPVAEKAKTVAALTSKGVPIEKIAMAFRLSKETIQQYVLMGELHEDVRKMVEQGKIPLSQVERITRKPYDEQLAFAQELAAVNRKAPSEGNATGPSGTTKGSSSSGSGNGSDTPTRGYKVKTDTIKSVYAGINPKTRPEAALVRSVLNWVLTREITDPVLREILETVPEVQRMKGGTSSESEEEASPKTKAERASKGSTKAAKAAKGHTPERIEPVADAGVHTPEKVEVVETDAVAEDAPESGADAEDEAAEAEMDEEGTSGDDGEVAIDGAESEEVAAHTPETIQTSVATVDYFTEGRRARDAGDSFRDAPGDLSLVDKEAWERGWQDRDAEVKAEAAPSAAPAAGVAGAEDVIANLEALLGRAMENL